MADFVNNLRMNSVFNPPDMDNYNPDQIRGMINMIYPLIEQSRDRQQQRQQNQMVFQNQLNKPPQDVGQTISNSIWGPQGNPALRQIAQNSLSGAPSGGFSLAPGAMTDYQKAQIDLQKQGLQQKDEMAEAKDTNADEERRIKQQRVDTYTNMHDLSDAEKLEIINRARAGDIEARGRIQRDLLGIRGDQAVEQIDERGKTASELESQRQTGRLAGIAATGEQQRQTNAAKPQTPESATQQTAAHQESARRILAQYSGMSSYIKFDDKNKNFSIDPNTPPEVRQWITDHIYGIQPAAVQQQNNTTPVAKTTPKATQPQSKYKVTVNP